MQKANKIISLAIMENEIKAEIKYHFLQIKMEKFQKPGESHCYQKFKRMFAYFVGTNANHDE